MKKSYVIFDQSTRLSFCVGKGCQRDCVDKLLKSFYVSGYYMNSEKEYKMRCPMCRPGMAIKNILQARRENHV